jgi:acetylglutamate kinase
MPHRHDPDAAIAALRRAVPYLRLYQGKVFVLKAGGEAFESAATARRTLEQVGVLHQLGIHVVLVHGGGGQASALSRRLGNEPRMVDGRRITDAAAREAAILAFCGEVATVARSAARALGVPLLSLSGIDAGLVRAERRPPQPQADGTVLDYGFVGDVIGVDAGAVRRLLDAGFLPAIAPLAADDQGEVLNVNADTIAAALAVGLRAEKLVLLTGAAGILRNPDDPGSVASVLDLAGLGELVESGAIRAGMRPKAQAIAAALDGGVPRVHVVSHLQTDALLREIFTNEGAGTMVVASSAAVPREESATAPR